MWQIMTPTRIGQGPLKALSVGLGRQEAAQTQACVVGNRAPIPPPSGMEMPEGLERITLSRRSFSHLLESTSHPDIPRPTAWEFLDGWLVRWWEKDRPRERGIERLVGWGSRSPTPPRIMKPSFSSAPCPAIGRTGETGRGPRFDYRKVGPSMAPPVGGAPGPLRARGDYWRVRVQRTRLRKPPIAAMMRQLEAPSAGLRGPAASREVLAIWARTDARSLGVQPRRLLKEGSATLCGRS